MRLEQDDFLRIVRKVTLFLVFRKDLTATPITAILPLSRPDRGALRNVTKRGAGCDGRGGDADERCYPPSPRLRRDRYQVRRVSLVQAAADGKGVWS